LHENNRRGKAYNSTIVLWNKLVPYVITFVNDGEFITEKGRRARLNKTANDIAVIGRLLRLTQTYSKRAASMRTSSADSVPADARRRSAANI
jgi:hypothetical protein